MRPWDNPEAPRFMGNELRDCRYLGLGLSWWGPQTSDCGQFHVVTPWGDELGSGTIPEGENPDSIKITDSDDLIKKGLHGVQTYSYDGDFNKNAIGLPHPVSGWYLLDYMVYPYHLYIFNVTTLCEAMRNMHCPGYGVNVTGSLEIHQNDSRDATGLEYVVGTDAPIYWYETSIDWEPNGGCAIQEHNPEPATLWSLTADWDLSPRNVPFSNDVTITTEFVLCIENEIYYTDERFTYSSARSMQRTQGGSIPSFKSSMTTPAVADTTVPWITGGHVICALEFYEDPARANRLGRYRFQHQYNSNQDPEYHEFLLESLQGTSCYVGDLRFGHSYGFLDKEALWAFDHWMTTNWGSTQLLDEVNPVTETLDWEGRLPYPVPCPSPNVGVPILSWLGLLLAIGALVVVAGRAIVARGAAS